MARVALLQGAGTPLGDVYSAAIAAAGNTIVDASSAYDAALMIAGTGTPNFAQAESLFAAGKTVFAQGMVTGPAGIGGYYTSPSLFSVEGGIVACPYSNQTITVTTQHPLTADWVTEPIGALPGFQTCATVQGHAAGAQTIGAVGSLPAYIVNDTATSFYAWYAGMVAPSAGFLQDLANYIASKNQNSGSGTTSFCSSTQPCPTGYTCVNGACQQSCASNANCPSGQVCQNGVCVTSTTSTSSTSLSNIPWWVWALIAGAVVFAAGKGEKHYHGGRTRTRTKVVYKHTHHRVTPHEASVVLRRREKQLHGR